MIYVVAPGDTLSGIARLSGSSVAQLQQDNGILPDQPLVPGQALVVPDRTARRLKSRCCPSGAMPIRISDPASCSRRFRF